MNTQDWHPADIVAALSRESGLSSSTLANVLKRAWPKGEWIIARRLNMHPAQIWPSRYFDMKGRMAKRKPRNAPDWDELVSQGDREVGNKFKKF
ncbi:helix-turn-helix transcriptional regulator [Xenorhabdus sp. TS4]|uniref:helix-turn-helix domain-containing protein n=1 Tax=Xenorhabdus sp. TS4 TaxID=1873483 RepID=UPI001657503F|nr:helix-turn-helix transcriptional regulator [Xenorhabdus sp. TS4]MBC8951079.1 transcriptional regulator [Xenorhabdus sp. TS4]